MTGIFFKAGEFADLCGVKKDTLLHYDHIGILKPEKVSDSGYRYYSVKQLYTFDLISALKRLGMSLQEIRAYLDSRSPENFLTLLEEQQLRLKEELRRLQQVGSLLDETITATKLAQSAPLNTITIRHCPEEYYVAAKAGSLSHYDEPQFLLRTRALLQGAKEYGSIAFPPGDIVTRESIHAGSFVEDYYYCRVSADTTAENRLTRPAGTYAIVYHQGSYETLENAYRQLCEAAIEKGYAIAGNLYEEDLVHYMSAPDPNLYIMKLSLQVEKESET